MSTYTMTVNRRNAAALEARRRQRRRAELIDTLAEAAATIGIGVSFIACSVLLICTR